MAIIGALADDLTGAMTAASLLTKSGVDSVVLLKAQYLGDGEPVCRRQAVVVNLGSRACSRENAYQSVYDATLRLCKLGIRHFSKRTDTTLRGDIGAEIDAMLDALGGDYIAVMVPAMPQSNRILVGGYSLINGVPLSKTSVAHDVRTPVRESFVPRLLASQTHRRIGCIGLEKLLGGRDILRRALQERRADGAEILLVDAISLADIEMIAHVIVELNWKTISVDPGPFTERMASAYGWSSQRPAAVRRIRNDPAPDDRGTVVVAAGSATPVTTMQMKALLQLPGTRAIPVPLLPLLDGEDACKKEIDAASQRATALLESDVPPRVLILAFETTLSGQLIDLREQESSRNLAEGSASDHIACCLGRIVRQTLDRAFSHVTGMYLTGGDVMASVCRMLDARGIELVDYVIPQADQGKLVGGPFDGLLLIGKGGLTGEENTAVQCVNRLFDERKLQYESGNDKTDCGHYNGGSVGDRTRDHRENHAGAVYL